MSADSDRDIDFRADGFAGLADLMGVGNPVGIHGGAGGADGGAENIGQFANESEVFRFLESAAAGDDDIGVREIDFKSVLGFETDSAGF